MGSMADEHSTAWRVLQHNTTAAPPNRAEQRLSMEESNRQQQPGASVGAGGDEGTGCTSPATGLADVLRNVPAGAWLRLLDGHVRRALRLVGQREVTRVVERMATKLIVPLSTAVSPDLKNLQGLIGRMPGLLDLFLQSGGGISASGELLGLLLNALHTASPSNLGEHFGAHAHGTAQ